MSMRPCRVPGSIVFVALLGCVLGSKALAFNTGFEADEGYVDQQRLGGQPLEGTRWIGDRARVTREVGVGQSYAAVSRPGLAKAGAVWFDPTEADLGGVFDPQRHGLRLVFAVARLDNKGSAKGKEAWRPALRVQVGNNEIGPAGRSGNAIRLTVRTDGKLVLLAGGEEVVIKTNGAAEKTYRGQCMTVTNQYVPVVAILDYRRKTTRLTVDGVEIKLNGSADIPFADKKATKPMLAMPILSDNTQDRWAFDNIGLALVGEEEGQAAAPQSVDDGAITVTDDEQTTVIASSPDGQSTRQYVGTRVFPANPLSNFGDIHGSGVRRAEASSEVVRDADHEHESILRVTTRGATGNPNAINIHVFSDQSANINEGDRMLVAFEARSTKAQSESGAGEMIVSLGEGGPKNWRTFAVVPVRLTDEWRRIELMGTAKSDYSEAEPVRVVLAVGGWPQVIEVADFQATNLGQDVTDDELPKLSYDYDYPGRSADAPWRIAAAERIEKYRKADLTVKVVDAGGHPVPDAQVRVAMTRHAFAFGTPVDISILAAGVDGPANLSGQYNWQPLPQDDVRRYREILSTYFNEAVFIIHARSWSRLQLTPQERIKPWHFHSGTMKWFDEAVAWAQAKDMSLRGHALTWTPTRDRLRTREGTPAEDMSMAEAHQYFIKTSIPERVGAMANRINEFDAINHPVAWRSGPSSEEEMRAYFAQHPEAINHCVEIMRAARAANPAAILYVNEGQILPGGNRIGPYRLFIEELIARDAGPDGIGFMGHFTVGRLEHPQTVYDRIDAFADLAPRLKITELDVDVPFADQTQADYLRDILTVAFSHPKMQGVNQWGFWESIHWRPHAALWREDWSLKPAGEAYVDLIRRQWWTDETVVTNADGIAAIRGFIGDYRVVATLPDGTTIKQDIELVREGTRVTLRN